MISKKSRKIQKEIDRKNKIEYEKSKKRRNEIKEEGYFMNEYRVCPHCSGKVKKRIWRSFFSEGKDYYKCLNCGLERNVSYTYFI